MVWATLVTHVPVGVLQHGVAALRGSPAATARAPGPAGGRGRCRRGRAGGAGCGGPGRAARRPRADRASRPLPRVGQRRPGPHRVEGVLLAGQPGAEHPRARGRAAGRRGGSPRPTSGTTSLAASVGVEARTSATRSSSGLSGSWPIADTTGVRAANTARSRPSSENGSRSSTTRRRGRPRSRRPRGRGRAGRAPR